MKSLTNDFDLDRDGKCCGFLRVSATTDRSPFGWTPVPIVSIRNGNGPCVLLIGGCHGDEYEGQIIAQKIAKSLDVQDICGQLIILPAANAPAVEVGRRVSPLDEGNLNRAFPGDPAGSPTFRIAHFIEHELLPRATLVIDLHSGGQAVEYVPSAMFPWHDDCQRAVQLFALVRVFGLPTAFAMDRADDPPSSMFGACERAGVLCISAELGGGGGISLEALQVAAAGVQRLLRHVGVTPETRTEAPPDVRIYRRLPVSKTVCAPMSGLFEPCVSVGQEVAAGDRAGFIYPIGTHQDAVEVSFSAGGVVLCRRVPAQTRHGDGLFKLGIPWEYR